MCVRVCVCVNVSLCQVHFVAPFPYHLNISQNSGQVCLGLLGDDKWEPTYMSIEHVLQALVAILIRPDVTSAIDHELLNNFHNFSSLYKSNAETSARTAARKYKMWLFHYLGQCCHLQFYFMSQLLLLLKSLCATFQCFKLIVKSSFNYFSHFKKNHVKKWCGRGGGKAHTNHSTAC